MAEVAQAATGKLDDVFNKTVVPEPVVEAKPQPTETKAKEPEKVAVPDAKPTEKIEVKDGKDQKEAKKEESGVLKPEPEVKKEEKPAVNWDDDTNPYKKRYQDTANWTNRVNQENATIKKQLELVNKKLDGTYDPVKDEITVTPDQIKESAELEGRLNASLAVATEKYGEEKVNQIIADFSTKYKDNPQIMGRVRLSKAPALEVMKIIQEQAFTAKYGNDPDTVYTKIKEETVKEMEARIREEITKEFNDRVQLKQAQPQGLSEVKGAVTPTGEKRFEPAALENLFR